MRKKPKWKFVEINYFVSQYASKMLCQNTRCKSLANHKALLSFFIVLIIICYEFVKYKQDQI